MRSKEEKSRIRYNKWKKKMRHKYGPNWKAHGVGGIFIEPLHEPLPVMTVEQMRLQLRRSQGIVPGVQQPSYTVGVSPNA